MTLHLLHPPILLRFTMKKYLKALALLPAFATLIACSSGNGSASTSSSSSSTVYAQTTYSTASLSGTYSVNWLNVSNSDSSNLGGYYTGIGTLKFDGAGNVTGSLNVYAANPTMCAYTITGTYSLQSTALGTATFKLDTSTSGCTSKPTLQVALAAGNGGAEVKMARTPDSGVISIAIGSAVKQ